MYLKKFYKDYNFNKILSLIYIILPVVFLLKHNLAGVILVVLSIISLILIIKNKITINFKQNVLIFFFFYIHNRKFNFTWKFYWIKICKIFTILYLTLFLNRWKIHKNLFSSALFFNYFFMYRYKFTTFIRI